MFLIMISVIFGLVGFQIGSMMGVEIFIYAFSIIGFTAPSMVM